MPRSYMAFWKAVFPVWGRPGDGMLEFLLFLTAFCAPALMARLLVAWLVRRSREDEWDPGATLSRERSPW